jgi:hypothetical protein
VRVLSVALLLQRVQEYSLERRTLSKMPSENVSIEPMQTMFLWKNFRNPEMNTLNKMFFDIAECQGNGQDC